MKPMEGRRQPGSKEVKAQAQTVLILVQQSAKLILMNREFIFAKVMDMSSPKILIDLTTCKTSIMNIILLQSLKS
jgi:hypothetical protein